MLVDLREQDDPLPSGTGRAASVVARLLADDAHPKTARRHAALKSGQSRTIPNVAGPSFRRVDPAAESGPFRR